MEGLVTIVLNKILSEGGIATIIACVFAAASWWNAREISAQRSKDIEKFNEARAQDTQIMAASMREVSATINRLTDHMISGGK